MNTETLARLISSADYLSFRDLALEYLAARGYQEVRTTDGWRDGGTDVRVFTLASIPDPFAFQITVEWDWKKKLYEDAEKVKSELGLRQMTLVASRRIAEAEFLDAADDIRQRFDVQVGRVDCQSMASKFFLDGKTTRVLEILGVPVGSTDPNLSLLNTARSEAAYAFVFFGKDTGRFREAVIDAAIAVAAEGPEALSRDAIEKKASAALALTAQQQTLVSGAFDRLLQRGDIVQGGSADTFLVGDQLANAQAAMRSLRQADWIALEKNVERIVLDATGKKALDSDVVRGICEGLGAVLLDTAHQTVAELRGADPTDITQRTVRPKLQRLHATFDALRVPEGQRRTQLLLELTAAAESSSIGQALLAGELFVSLVSGPTPTLVSALGARTKVTAMLDASVGIPMLCSLYYRPAPNRFSIAAHHAYRQLRGRAIPMIVPDEYLEEMAAHLVNAGRDYSGLVDVETDLIESENAFVAHYASLRLAGHLDGGFPAYLANFGLDASLNSANFTVARDVVAHRMRAHVERYGIQSMRLPFATRAARKAAEEAVGYALHEEELERPRVVVEHDVRALAFLIDSDSAADGAYVLCTWDRLHITIRSRIRGEWLAIDPASLGDLLTLTRADGDVPLRSASVLAMALSEAVVKRGAEVLDRLVRIERGNLYDADLLKTAREFKTNYVKRVARGETVAPIAKAWTEWRAKTAVRG